MTRLKAVPAPDAPETTWATAAELAAMNLPDVPATERGVQLLAKREGWHDRRDLAGTPMARQRKGRGGGWEFDVRVLPERAQIVLQRRALAARENGHDTRSAIRADRSPAESWAWFERLPDKKKAVAERRATSLRSVKALQRGGMRKNAAVHEVARHVGVTASTIYAWFDRVAGLDESDWLPALAPHNAGRTKTVACDPRAWEYLKADYLRPAQPTFTSCYDRLQLVAAERGWPIPSGATLRRRLEREIRTPVRVLAREGLEALRRTYPAQERDRSQFHALEAVNADGHRADVFVRWEDGTIGRPVLLAVQDLYSGKVLGWRIDRTESAHLVQLTFGDVFRAYGIPDHAWLDNGRGFASKWITGGQKTRYRFQIKEADPTGVLTQLGVEVRWTNPYSGQSKPIERAFRDLCDRLWKHPAFDGAYTGNRPDAKPEDYGRRAIPVEQFRDVVNAGISLHNARTGRRSQVCGGTLSFDQAFDASYRDALIRKASVDQLRMCLMAAERVTARRPSGALHVMGNRYWAEFLAEHVGAALTVLFDPDDLYGGVEVKRLDGSYLGFAECWEAAGFADLGAARRHQRARKQYLKAQKAMLDAERTLTADQIAALEPTIDRHEPPAPAALRLVTGRGAAAAAAVDPDAMSADEFEESFGKGLTLIQGDREEI